LRSGAAFYSACHVLKALKGSMDRMLLALFHGSMEKTARANTTTAEKSLQNPKTS
jgi:hypothetical protein